MAACAVDHPPLPLRVLLEQIDAGLGEDAEALLLRFRADRDGVELGMLPLPPETHPVDGLLGFQAEPDWQAVGLVAPGTAHSTDATSSDPPSRVRILYAVDRAGRSAGLVRAVGDQGPKLPALGPDEEPEGHIVDLCRRILGLPTPPAPGSPLTWLAGLWLERILADALDQPRRWTWPELARRHPLATIASSPSTPTELAALGAIGSEGRSITWGRLRELAATNRGRATLDPRIAAWMDDGMFARWLLSARMDPDQMLADLEAVLEPADLHHLTDVLHAWDVI